MTKKEFMERVQEVRYTVEDPGFTMGFNKLTKVKLNRINWLINEIELGLVIEDDIINTSTLDSLLELEQLVGVSMESIELLYCEDGDDTEYKVADDIPAISVNDRTKWIKLLSQISNSYDIDLGILTRAVENATEVILNFGTHYLTLGNVVTRHSSQHIMSCDDYEAPVFYTITLNELTMEIADSIYLDTNVQLIIK